MTPIRRFGAGTRQASQQEPPLDTHLSGGVRLARAQQMVVPKDLFPLGRPPVGFAGFIRRAAFAAILSITCLAPSTAFAQGTIVGRVFSNEGTPLAGAQITIQIAETGMREVVRSDLGGRYIIENVQPGVHTMLVRLIGYTAKTITGVQVQDGDAFALDVVLNPQIVTLDAMVVTSAVSEAGSVAAALDEQRNADNIVSSVTAEQIQKSPDSDAGQALQRVSGVTIREGGFVIARGLGERYTTASLNGTRIPSPEPESRSVPLDLFPAGLLEGITTTKSYQPDQPGDWSGAQVDLKTREFPAQRQFSLSIKTGMNTNATGKTVLRGPREGAEWAAFGGAARDLPVRIDEAGTFQGLSQIERSQLINEFRNVWTTPRGTGMPSMGLSASLGGEDPIFGQSIGYVASLTYSADETAKLDQVSAIAFPDGASGGLRALNDNHGSSGTRSVSWGGLLNLSTRIGLGTKVDFNNTYTRSADNTSQALAGFNEDFTEDLDLTRLTYVERWVRSNQLRASHLLGTRHLFEWSVTNSAISRVEPDRSDLAYVTAIDPTAQTSDPQFWFGTERSASRTFGDIYEKAWQGSGDYQLTLGSAYQPLRIKVGGFYKAIDRTADSRTYEIANFLLDETARSNTAETVLHGTNPESGRLLLTANAAAGRYVAKDRNLAGYLKFSVPLSERFDIVGGARVERSEIDVATTSVTGAETPTTLENTDILPALALNFKVADDHVLRASGSQTVARPEYRELSPVTYFDILGGQRLFGNPNLRRSLIQNADLRWEFYPNPGEVVSIAGFAKRFQDPIERVLVQTSGGASPDASFINAESAWNLGVEFEIRKSLDFVSERLFPFAVFGNVTVMHSDITIGTDSISSLTNDQRPLVGQSPYVVNAGVTYAHPYGGFTATLLYNVNGRRIREAGIAPLPDTYEEARHILDLSVQFPVMRTISVKLDGKNLLDSRYEITQGTVLREAYRIGRTFNLALQWTPGR